MIVEPRSQIIPTGRAVNLRAWALPLALVGVVLLTFFGRAIMLDRSYNIFIDEISYLRLGQSVAETGVPRLYGRDFHLHPPAFFFIEAGYLRLIQAVESPIAQIYALRYLNVICAVITAAMLLLIGRHVAGLAAGLAAATIFAVDSFIIRMNSLVLLDTSAIMWVTIGYALLIPALPEAERRPLLPWRRAERAEARINAWLDRFVSVDRRGVAGTRRVALWRLLGAGICFGLGLLTKDMTAFLSLLPLGLIFLLGWPLGRGSTFVVGSTIVLAYLPYPIMTALYGDWERLADSKLRGVLRLVGLKKETGVNREGGVSLLEAVLSRLDSYATTYVLILGGAVALLVLLALGGRASRLLACWVGSAYALLGYCILFGTLEEQFFYFLVVPAIVGIASAAALLLRALRPGGRLIRPLRVGLAALAALALAWNAYQWGVTRSSPDNSFEQALAFIDRLPPGARVASTNQTGQFLLPQERRAAPWGSWGSLEALRGSSADYVLISTDQLAWSHRATADELVAWLEANGEPVFSFRSERERGDLVLYELRARP